nr:hypothetical protein [Lachnospiraceae bacterium]
EDAYSGKAEEHMVDLIRNNEAEKRAGKHTIIGLIMGLIMILLFVAFIMFSAGGYSYFYFFLDFPTILSVFGLQFVVLGVAGQLGDYFRSFKIAFAPGKFDSEQLNALAEKSEHAISFGLKALLLSGALSIAIEIVSMGYWPYEYDRISLMFSIAVVALSLFYPTLAALIMYAIKGRIHRLIA